VTLLIAEGSMMELDVEVTVTVRANKLPNRFPSEEPPPTIVEMPPGFLHTKDAGSIRRSEWRFLVGRIWD
jgi:hypothetical protein